MSLCPFVMWGQSQWKDIIFELENEHSADIEFARFDMNFPASRTVRRKKKKVCCL